MIPGSSVPSPSGLTGNDNIIPPNVPGAPRTKTLVLCFDGTGGQFFDNSNVSKFVSLLHFHDRHEQMVYYQAGIGTYANERLVTPAGRRLSSTVDKMVAWNLDAHIMAGYEFLVQNYEADDKICLFGFSRGAYIAGALAGMLHYVGLLPPSNHQEIPVMYKMYRLADNFKYKQLRNPFSIKVTIAFMGVWDTVCSVGLIPRWLPMTASNTSIRVFRHALSLDERRAKFEVHHYHHFEEDDLIPDSDLPWELKEIGKVKESEPWFWMRKWKEFHIVPQFLRKNADNEEKEKAKIDVEQPEILGVKQPEIRGVEQPEIPGVEQPEIPGVEQLEVLGVEQLKMDIKEVWFAGCHGDVGGGSVPNTVKYSLARIPLRWMIREVFRTNIGIRFNVELLKDIGFDVTSLWPHARPAYDSRFFSPQTRDAAVPAEREEERRDALCPIYDQLRLKPWWWVLEMVPIKQRESKKWMVNLGRGRTVPPSKKPFYVHLSVKMRQDEEVNMRQEAEARMRQGEKVRTTSEGENAMRNLLKSPPYKPKANWGGLEPIYVD